MGQGASEKRAASILRTSIAGAFIISVFIVLLGSGLNNLNLKYSRSSSHVLKECKKEIFILSVPDSKHCCDSSVHSLDWVCVASFDKFNRVLSSQWAFFIPLLPFLMTTCSGYASEIVSKTRSSVIHSSRLLIYICIILYRSVSHII